MSGTDGYENKNLVKITWEQFQVWQRWDEFPERSDDPPMTVDMSFVYLGTVYYIDAVNNGYAILTDKWERIVFDLNFKNLLYTPVELWSDKSFVDLIDQFLFVD